MRSVACVACVLWVVPSVVAQSPYDAIEAAYTPYLSADDPLAFPMKAQSLAADPHAFWRGGKDLFFAWARDACGDWLGDAGAVVAAHGDVHVGNVGTYAADGAWGRLAVGLVDFDDAARLPFQLELLQGAITLRLAATQNGRVPSDAEHRAVVDRLVASYRAALDADGNATDLLKADAAVLDLLRKGAKRAYVREVEECAADGRFRATVRNKRGELKDVLRPAADRADDVAAALARAAADAPALRARLRAGADAAGIRAAIRDVAQRTRVGSSGSQGLRKYLVLLDRPFTDYDGDVVLYLKQQIPPAAERAGVAPPDPRSPGRRVAEETARLTDPDPSVNAWCEMGGASYCVTMKDPWGEEFATDDVATQDDAVRLAAVWGTVVGAAHRAAGARAAILPRLAPGLPAVLDARAAAYAAQVARDHAAFAADDRVRALVAKATASTASAR